MEKKKDLEVILEKIKDIDGDYFDRVAWDGSVDFEHEKEEILLIKEALIRLLVKLITK